MIKAAIVEDDISEARALETSLYSFCEKNGVGIDIEIFDKPIAFLNCNKADRDIVFLDIEMPGMNGIEVAEKLRGSDDGVLIVFVTHMAQFAVDGYKVDAVDFLVKPVKHAEIENVMRRILRRLAVEKKTSHLIRSISGVTRVDVSDIMYVEIYKHRLCYHMTDGKKYEAWGSLKELETELPARAFARCNNCYLVNLQFVRAVKDGVAYVGDDRLAVSRPRKREFTDRLVAFMGE